MLQYLMVSALRDLYPDGVEQSNPSTATCKKGKSFYSPYIYLGRTIIISRALYRFKAVDVSCSKCPLQLYSWSISVIMSGITAGRRGFSLVNETVRS